MNPYREPGPLAPFWTVTAMVDVGYEVRHGVALESVVRAWDEPEALEKAMQELEDDGWDPESIESVTVQRSTKATTP